MADVVLPGRPSVTIGNERLPSSVDLVLWKGDYFEAFVEVTDENDVPVDLTGKTPHAAIRSGYGSDPSFTLDTSIVNGEVRIYIPSATSSQITAGDYVWDLSLENSNGDVRTYLAGDVQVYNEVNPNQ